MTKRLLLIASLLLISCFSFSSDYLEFRYMGYIFSLPPNPNTILSAGDYTNVVTFGYDVKSDDGDDSIDKIKIYIRSIDPDDRTIDLEAQDDCDIRLFMDDMHGNKKESGCNQVNRDAYYSVSLEGNDYGIWPGKAVQIYYVVDDSMTTITLISEDKTDVLLQTVNMSKAQIKNVLSNYISE